ncbi:hypothetical protein [Jeongeupia chitinilytica]|uniref:Uncharacterized protein n=1 Tax=Jeongeupia chitinilytica TaxID=1041641 RepID=A0ABQ3GZ75_9NEIS|nr:hypothetical protein [Jeongeupia chitinilytica]GHD59841.1 hypothetical protein GCM10007350_11730 [Jeongeupia chitinilytica]
MRVAVLFSLVVVLLLPACGPTNKSESADALQPKVANTCTPSQVRGSYADSCYDCGFDVPEERVNYIGTLYCACRQRGGGAHGTRIDLQSCPSCVFSNDNGHLVCGEI